MPPGASAPDGRVEQLALQLRELRDIRRLLAPARLGAAAERAEPRARRVEQDAVEAARCAERVEVELAAVADVHLDGRSGRRRAPCARARPAPGPSRSRPASRRRRAPRPRARAVLPPGPGAEVEPPLPRARRAGAASARAPRAASPRPAPGRARSTPRRRRWGRPADATPIGEYRSGSSPGDVVDVDAEPRQRGEVHARRGVVGREQLGRARRRAPRAASAARKARTIQRGWLSSRARRSSSPVAPVGDERRATPRATTREIVRSTALAKPGGLRADAPRRARPDS